MHNENQKSPFQRVIEVIILQNPRSPALGVLAASPKRVSGIGTFSGGAEDHGGSAFGAGGVFAFDDGFNGCCRRQPESGCTRASFHLIR